MTHCPAFLFPPLQFSQTLFLVSLSLDLTLFLLQLFAIVSVVCVQSIKLWYPTLSLACCDFDSSALVCTLVLLIVSESEICYILPSFVSYVLFSSNHDICDSKLFFFSHDLSPTSFVHNHGGHEHVSIAAQSCPCLGRTRRRRRRRGRGNVSRVFSVDLSRQRKGQQIEKRKKKKFNIQNDVVLYFFKKYFPRVILIKEKSHVICLCGRLKTT